MKNNNTVVERSRFKMKKTRAKGWVTVGITSLALLGVGVLTSENVDASTAKDNIATVNYVTGYGINLWKDAPKVVFQGQHINNGTTWKTFGAVKGMGDSLFYDLGINQLADSKNMDLSNENSKQELIGVVKINYVPGYGINIWDRADNGRQPIGNKKLAHGTTWKVYARQVVNGKTWYNLGGNQWLEGRYANLIHESRRGEKIFFDGVPKVDNSTSSNNNINNGNDNNSNTNNGSHSGNTSTTSKVKYANINVKVVDETGAVLKQSTISRQAVGKQVTVTAPLVAGYDVQGTKTKSINVVEGTNEVVFNAKKHIVTPGPKYGVVEINLVDIDTGVLLKKTTLEHQEAGKKIVVTAPTVEGYDIQGKGTQTITVIDGINSLLFTAKKKVVTPEAKYADLVIEVVDSETGSVLKRTTERQEVGKRVTVHEPIIEGYETHSSTTKTLTISKGTNKLIFEVKKIAPVTEATIAQIEQEFLVYLNNFRAENGKGALQQDANLMAGAKVRAQQEADAVEAGGLQASGRLNYALANHKLPDGGKFGQESNLKAFGGLKAENLVTGVGNARDTAKEIAEMMFALWKNSSGHRTNMLGDYNYTGIGVIGLSDGTYVAINDFGKKYSN